MKSYNYTASIIDDGGNIVAEIEDRTLTADEVIAMLVQAKSKPPNKNSTKPRATNDNTGKGCPECGSPSRHKKTCSKAGGQKSFPPCGECKKVDKHAKWCSKREVAENGAALSRQVNAHNSKGALSQMQFGRVKISQSHDIPSDVIARNLDVDVAEIEKAFEHETYSDYKAA